MKIFCDQQPLAENRVSLSNERDEFGIPKINVDWTLSSKDKDDIRHYVRVFRDLMVESGLGAFVPNIDLEEEEPWPIVGFNSHFMGAARMGNDEGSSVTDSYGRVHGYDNIFVSGPSLFASYGFANPFFPIIVFALRISKKILAISR